MFFVLFELDSFPALRSFGRLLDSMDRRPLNARRTFVGRPPDVIWGVCWPQLDVGQTSDKRRVDVRRTPVGCPADVRWTRLSDASVGSRRPTDIGLPSDGRRTLPMLIESAEFKKEDADSVVQTTGQLP